MIKFESITDTIKYFDSIKLDLKFLYLSLKKVI